MSDLPPSEVSPNPDLSELLVALTESVEGLRVDFRRERKAVDRKFTTAAQARRKSNLAMGLACLILFAGFIAQWWQFSAREHDRAEKERGDVEALVKTCVNGNATRAGIVRLFDVYTVTLGQLSPSATPEAEERKAQLIAKMRSDFALAVPPELGPRDCSVKAVTTPTTFPPSTTIAPG